MKLGICVPDWMARMNHKMKFWQRCLILLGAACLSLTVYLMTQEDANLDRQLPSHMVRAQPWHLHFAAKAAAAPDPEICHFAEQHASSPNVSTFDLYQTSPFNMKSDGSYELPSPPPEYPGRETESLPPLTVIVMPHSHCDPGWLKTVDEYYVDQTKHILMNMVNKLTQFPEMTFVWSETVFLSMWWNELEDAIKTHVRRLIRRGQLEIALGGWVVPDEATTHFVSVLDQLVEGHQWLWENLGIKPMNSWAIDPFGYSGTMPYLWQQSGLKNMVIQRVHQAIKGELISRKALEFFWRQQWDPTGSTDILTHVMPYMLYSIKYTCGPNRYLCLLFDFRSIPMEASETRAKNITNENIQQQAHILYEQYRRKAYLYQHNTILVPVGDDFRYDREIEWDQQHKNYALLMYYMNNRKDWNINVRFGTLKDYFRLIRENEAQEASRGGSRFPVLSGDFFPYSDQNREYWTGYYTTRPFDKRFSRDVQASLQSADILNTLVYLHYKQWKKPTQEIFFQFSYLLRTARRSLGLFMHHDATTGTAKEFVVKDYEEQLLHAYNATQEVSRKAVQWLLSAGRVESPHTFYPETVRQEFNQGPVKKVIKVLETGTRLVLVNSLPHFRQQMVHVIVDTDKVLVKNDRYKVVPCQVNPVWADQEIVRSGQYELVFMAEIPPFSIVPYIIVKMPYIDNEFVFPARISMINSEELIVPPEAHFKMNRPEPRRERPVTIENKEIQIVIGPSKGTLDEIVEKSTGNRTLINLHFLAYKSQGSGAYIFFPSGKAKAVFHTSPVIRIVEGPVASYVEMLHDPYLHARITLYQHPSLQAKGVYIHNTLNIQTLKEREIIMRMSTEIKNPMDVYYTDQNGFQHIKRRTNKALRIEANYYPMTSSAFLEDSEKRMTLLSAQPHGVGGLKTGQLEVMLDRQTEYDDNRGLGEPIKDIKTVGLDFVLLLETRSGDMPPARNQYALPSLLALELGDFLQQPVFMYYSLIETDVFHNSVEPLSNGLPCDYTVTSLRSLATGNFVYNGTSLILHRRGYDCSFPAAGMQCAKSDPQLSLDDLFKKFPVMHAEETSLTHLHQKGTVQTNSPLSVHPMELAAYLVTW